MGRWGDEDVSARLTVDLDAVVENYRRIESTSAPAAVASVVKANAYGLGAIAVSGALYAAGCRRFFTAQLGEALALRNALPDDATFYVLNGLWPGTEIEAAQAGIVPVLNSLDQVRRWRRVAASWAPPVGDPPGRQRHVPTRLTREDVRVLPATLTCCPGSRFSS